MFAGAGEELAVAYWWHARESRLRKRPRLQRTVSGSELSRERPREDLSFYPKRGGENNYESGFPKRDGCADDQGTREKAR